MLKRVLKQLWVFSSGFLLGVGLLIYDELLTTAYDHRCYNYPLIGCYDVWTASWIPFVLVLVGALQALLLGSRHEAATGEE